MEAFEPKNANGPRAACSDPTEVVPDQLGGVEHAPLSAPLFLRSGASKAPSADQPFNSSIFRHVRWRSTRRVKESRGEGGVMTKVLEELAGADMHRDGCSVCCCRRRCRGPFRSTAACTPGTTNYFTKRAGLLVPFLLSSPLWPLCSRRTIERPSLYRRPKLEVRTTNNGRMDTYAQAHCGQWGWGPTGPYGHTGGPHGPRVARPCPQWPVGTCTCVLGHVGGLWRPVTAVGGRRFHLGVPWVVREVGTEECMW